MKITLFVSNPFMIMFILFNSFRQYNRRQKSDQFASLIFIIPQMIRFCKGKFDYKRICRFTVS